MCPLCCNKSIEKYFTDKKRVYFQCLRCGLVFVHPSYLPSLSQEKREYKLHNNSFDDKGYVLFLSRILKYVPESLCNKTILDFGCGPSPVLAGLCHQKMHGKVSFYDPIYFNNTSILNTKYDFIFCTEAIEHFHKPLKEWSLLMRLLKSSEGKLLIMTKRVVNKACFSQWHYKNDPTHVCFFSEFTFRYLAKVSNLTVTFPKQDIAVFSRSSI